MSWCNALKCLDLPLCGYMVLYHAYHSWDAFLLATLIPHVIFSNFKAEANLDKTVPDRALKVSSIESWEDSTHVECLIFMLAALSPPSHNMWLLDRCYLYLVSFLSKVMFRAWLWRKIWCVWRYPPKWRPQLHATKHVARSLTLAYYPCIMVLCKL